MTPISPVKCIHVDRSFTVANYKQQNKTNQQTKLMFQMTDNYTCGY